MAVNETANAIELEHVAKTYRVPVHRVETFKERVLHPFRSVEYRELGALDDVSFDIGAGEFFGIAGRNGSGKTTLLKLLASIYAPDSGRIRIAGRVAPFIELGVGFNPELAARDNILLNGVMMGLTPREARMRADRVIEFAELGEFTELKLKNYSSGMRVRLGFAVLVEADADVLLIDEVLAVGDANFQQKCTDVFYDFKRQGRTIVLVTHDMTKLDEYCDRAVLLHEGQVEAIGDADAVGQRYMELNFSSDGTAEGKSALFQDEFAGSARITDFRFENDAGEAAESLHHGEPIFFRGEIEVYEPIGAAGALGAGTFVVALQSANGQRVFEVRSDPLTSQDGPLRPRDTLSVRGKIDNNLVGGRYTADVSFSTFPQGDMTIAFRHGAASLLVYGTENTSAASGLILPEHEFHVAREHDPSAQPD
jgi:ABC-2 type transport system ATP-binding protein